MIITVTGKPCSGKGSVSKHFCAESGFKYMSTGNMFRELAKQNGYDDILEFQMNESITKIDNQVDYLIENLGKEKLHEDIVIDSRLAWHFIPKSFKVFIDVDWRTAGERLLRAERETEKGLILELKVDTTDMGKVIGKQGRIAKAIRSVVKAAASREDKKVIIEIE